MLTLVLTCFVVAVVIAVVRKQLHSANRLPTIQAMLYFLALGAEHDARRPERAQGLIDALKRAAGEAERQKAEELLRTVVRQGPPSQVQPALAAIWILGFPDFEELLTVAIQRECLTRDSWDGNLETLKSQLST